MNIKIPQLSRDDKKLIKPTERILQFGEGNFLRCFIDWQIDILNETKGLDAGVIVVRPIDTDFPPSLNTQDGLYTSLVRGYDEEGQLHEDARVISCVTREISIYQEYQTYLQTAHISDIRFVFSNTTEAGIVYVGSDAFEDAPASSFPAKLTRWLYERYTAFNGAVDRGVYLIPCELIDYNGDALKQIVLQYCDLWDLPGEFVEWLYSANTFCSTLVDRIVTGYPREEAENLEEAFGYSDSFITTGEFFHLFVIQGPESLAEELRIDGSGLNIRMVEDLKPYKQRKVGILNGSHTALVPVGFLSGIDTVRGAVEDEQIQRFLDRLIQEEIIPNLGLPLDYAREFAASVIDRFKNPFVDHKLYSIALNSMTKFKTRVLPQFLEYARLNGTVPPLMTLSLAALISFYRGERTFKDINGVTVSETYKLQDNPEFLSMYEDLWGNDWEPTRERIQRVVHHVLSLQDHWGTDLSAVSGLETAVTDHVAGILDEGMFGRLSKVLNS